MSFMENQVRGYKCPLYRRRTAQFKLHPFTFFAPVSMLGSFSVEEKAVLYGVTDGIPEYPSRIQPGLDMDTAFVSLFFEESGRLFEEPFNFLKQELREPAFYHSILTAMAGGAGEMVYRYIVKPQLNDFMGTVFETICLQYLYLPQIYRRLPFPLGNAGRWRGNNPEKQRQEEMVKIDIA